MRQGVLQWRAVADPLRRGRSPVARQGVDAPGILRTDSLERNPGLGFWPQPPSRALQPGPRLPKFLDLDANLTLVRQAEVQHQVLDAVASHRPGELGPAYRTVVDRGQHQRGSV